jgi:hypothetical protein
MRSRLNLVAVATCAVVSICPVVASAEESSTKVSTTRTTAAEYNESASAEVETTYRPNRPLLLGGAALFVFPYAASVGVAFKNNPQADSQLFVPVAGPWMDLDARTCVFGQRCSTRENVASGLVVASGIAQATGVILMVASLFVPEHAREKASRDVQVAPVALSNGAGVGAFGAF